MFWFHQHLKTFLNRNRPIKIKVIVSILKIINVLVLLRHTIFNKLWNWSVMGEANYLFGEMDVISIILANGALILGILIASLIHYNESANDVIRFLNDIKTRGND